MNMRRMIRNCKAYAFTSEVLLLLLIINGSEQGTDHSSSSSSSSSASAEDTSSDISVGTMEDQMRSECGYSDMAGFTLTEEAKMILFGHKIDSKFGDPPSSFSDSSEVCLPEDPDAKPSDEPQMHCYKLGPTGRMRSSNISYAIRGYSKRLNRSQVDDVMARSFKAWSDVTPLSFRRVDSGAMISITFPADLGTGVMGVGSYPNSSGTGTIRFNDNLNWATTSAGGKNLHQVATHEIGHTLGLAHSENRAAIMYPTYPPGGPSQVRLHSDDIAGIRALYGSGRGSTSSPTPPRAPVTPNDPQRNPTPPRGNFNQPRGRGLSQPRGRGFSQPRGTGFSQSGGFSQPRGTGFSQSGGFSQPGGFSQSGVRARSNAPRDFSRPGAGRGARSWHQTPKGNVHWPPVRRGGRDMIHVWGQGGARQYYYSDQGQRKGWFPYQ